MCVCVCVCLCVCSCVQHGCDPERLMLHQRTVAAALHLPVTVENVDMRFDDVALARIEKTLFEPHTNLVSGSSGCTCLLGVLVNCD